MPRTKGKRRNQSAQRSNKPKKRKTTSVIENPPKPAGPTFLSLPREIRQMIYDLLIEKRLISLAYDRVLNGPVQIFFAKKPPCFLLPSPQILSICQDSRVYALSKGYRPWDLRNSQGKTLRMMFSPDLDTISFPRTASLGDFNPAFFPAAFPEVTQYIKKLALPSTHWRIFADEKAEVLDHISLLLWHVFKSVTDIWVMFEPDFEGDHTVLRNPKGWYVPRDIQSGIEKEREKFPWKNKLLGKKAPQIRVVLDESDIMEGAECCLILRSMRGYDSIRSLCKYVKDRREDDDW
ncbi:hypothetical protein HYFRA_00011276 [Hymenoscyphus fraxineus]|uniref:2EXR domain-containing protein n=1 Tax=Hymenoscyphus fraxineus TaxID=746836 RepID=A0A9N9PJ28_9HELO|nr:hypothetical protein HYFRA_00011276 [Hymenoscyphus fraxineus]